MENITQLLSRIERGDPTASAELLPLVYDELRKLAANRLHRERAVQTLQPTDLVHEAYLRLAGAEADQPWDGRGHFFAAAAEAMRRILIDRARAKATQKRGDGNSPVPLEIDIAFCQCPPAEQLAINEAIEALCAAQPEAGDLVKLHVFVGVPISEAADSLGISRATAYRQWSFARAWLLERLDDRQ